MRKIIVLSMMSMDGVIQGPGAPKEDESNDFKYGGWVAPFTDEEYDKVVEKELEPADYLLGRKTFDIWADYWPNHGEFWPGIITGNKYVFSQTLENSDPKVTRFINSEIIKTVDDIRRIKNSNGPDLQVWGSSELVHLLLQNDLVDELRLKIHPLILGKGKRLFNDDSMAAAFSLTESIITGTGVIMAAYKRAGNVTTGTVGV